MAALGSGVLRDEFRSITASMRLLNVSIYNLKCIQNVIKNVNRQCNTQKKIENKMSNKSKMRFNECQPDLCTHEMQRAEREREKKTYLSLS